MGKEITLDELVKSSNAKPAVRAEEVNNEITKETKVTDVVTPSNIKSAKPISAADLGKNLQDKNPESNSIVEESPLVANAFTSAIETLEKKKRFYDEEVIPVMMENAREMAMEKELEMDEEELNDEEELEENDKEVDIFSELDEEDEVKEEEKSVYVAPKEVVLEKPEEEVKPKKVVEAKPDTTIVYKKEDNTFEDMLKDFGIDTEEETDVIDTEEETTEELRERFKASLESVKITRNPIDLSKFQIAKEPVSSAMVLNAIGAANKKRCDHPLLHSRRNMTFEECSGPELDALRKTINNSNGVNGVIASLRFVYNHNIDANKKSFEAWCKSIRTEDIESLYFGMYKACYGDTNLLARVDDADKACNKTSLINTPISSMYKFKDDDAKKLYDELMSQDTTNPGAKIKSQTMVISDDFVVSYTDPTLYSTFIQYASLKPEVTNKYADQLNTMAYIDGFFRIDYEHNQLIPIAIKEYPNNINKTVMSKLKTYIDILKTLSNDQYNLMVSKLDNIIGEPLISYIYPETTCPECGNTISEERVESMLSLLFTRAQLVQVKNL